MILWLIFALMTLAAVLAVWWPLARRQKAVRSGSDVAVYRDQLDEIDRDEAASLIGSVEAEAARVEVSRRLIAAAESRQSRKRRRGARSGRPLSLGNARRRDRSAPARRGHLLISRWDRRISSPFR